MAVYNEILVGRFNRALQKGLGMKGGPPAPQVGSEIVPGIQLFWGADMRYVEGWNRFGGRVLAAAAAASSSAARLRNPKGSGAIIVIEKMSFGLGAGTSVVMGFERPASIGTFPLVGSGVAWDSRVQGSGAGLVEGKNNNATQFGSVVGVFFQVAVVQLDIIQTDIQEIPLLPGEAVTLTLVLQNTSGDFTFWWRERPLEDSELT